MKVTETGFENLLVLEPMIYKDERGHFLESYNRLTLNQSGIKVDFVQDNESFSRRGVLRGLHFQRSPSAQTKLVRVLSGTVLDVVVDLRTTQPTFKKVYTTELSADNKRQLLVPKGFAHSFVVLSETASVLYKCDNYYDKSSEGGIRFDDPDLNIEWPFTKQELVVSQKDLELPYLSSLNYHF